MWIEEREKDAVETEGSVLGGWEHNTIVKGRQADTSRDADTRSGYCSCKELMVLLISDIRIHLAYPELCLSTLLSIINSRTLPVDQWVILLV